MHPIFDTSVVNLHFITSNHLSAPWWRHRGLLWIDSPHCIYCWRPQETPENPAWTMKIVRFQAFAFGCLWAFEHKPCVWLRLKTKTAVWCLLVGVSINKLFEDRPNFKSTFHVCKHLVIRAPRSRSSGFDDFSRVMILKVGRWVTPSRSEQVSSTEYIFNIFFPYYRTLNLYHHSPSLC